MAPENKGSWPHTEAGDTMLFILWEVPCKRSEDNMCEGGSVDS